MALSSGNTLQRSNGWNSQPAVRPDTLPKQYIELSPEEQRSGRLTPEHQALAELVLSLRGYIILRNALPPDRIDRIAREFGEIYEDCRRTLGTVETGSDAESQFQVQESRVKRAAFWYRKSRWRIFPKLVGPMGDPMLMANPFVVPILQKLLGADFYCKYLSSDICVKGAILQSPHSDIDTDDTLRGGRWVPRGFVVNVPLMECGLHNGPLEVWPGGSHMWNTELVSKHGLCPNMQDGRNPPVERAVEYFHSIKVALQPGEILIRDLAMWHRGTPNPTDEPRTMLTAAYFRKSRAFGYGDPSYNLDREIYDQLDPQIRRMFAYHFCFTAEFRRQRRELRGKLKRLLSRA